MEDNYEKFSAKMADKYPEYFGEDKHFGGFAIGDGWYDIIDTLAANIKNHMDWKEQMRQYDIQKFNAREQGREAVLNLICNGHTPTDWDEQRADDIMEQGVVVAPAVAPIQIQQIKEKFGGLRFYYQGGDEVVDGMVRMAEAWAGATCETCGDKGKRRSGGWVRTLCDKHEEEYQQKSKNMRDEDE